MVLAERLTSQLLSGKPATSPEEVTRLLLAVQAQDARGARLAIRVRTSGLTAADIDRALDDRVARDRLAEPRDAPPRRR